MSLVGTITLLAVILVHTALAAVGTRFFRVRMNTTWGATVYALTVLPVVLLVSMLVFTGFLGLGRPVGGVDVALLLVVVLPLLMGYAIDVFWVPSPEEIDLPETS